MEEFIYNYQNKLTPFLCNDEFNNWISLKNNSFITNEKQPNASLPNITEFKTFLKSLIHLQKLFQENLLLYENDENDKQIIKVKLDKIKEQMEVFHQILRNDSYIKSVKEKLYKINKRRKYINNKQEKIVNRKLEKQRRIQEIGLKTDQWLMAKREQENDKKIQKAEKQNVKSVISDVVNRIREINEKIDLIDSALKLRQLKKKDKIEYQNSEQISDEFDNQMHSIRNLLVSKLDSYEMEKIKLMEQSISSINKSEIMESKKFRLSVVDRVNEMLFGNNYNNIRSDSNYERFYNQAMNDINHFLLIRSHWDSYIVNEENSGSYLPVTWVLPSVPSAESSWQQVLE